MVSDEFITRFEKIQDKIYLLVPDFDTHTNFPKLLDTINQRNIFPESVFRDLLDLWRVRNSVISTPDKSTIDSSTVAMLKGIELILEI